MGGRGSGPPKGNLNASRNIIPALRRIMKGQQLPAKYNRVLLLAENEANELISDKGGIESMSGAEKLMVANWKSGRQCELLIWTELIERGAIAVDKEGNWDLQPGLRRLVGLLMAQQRALISLGLERRQKPVGTVADYLRQKAEEKER